MRSCSPLLTPAYSLALDHLHASGRLTYPRRTGFPWMYSTVSPYSFTVRSARSKKRDWKSAPRVFPAPFDPARSANLDGLHRFGDRHRMSRINDRVPVIRQQHPGRERKSVPLASGADQVRNQSQLARGENAASSLKFTGHEKIPFGEHKPAQTGHEAIIALEFIPRPQSLKGTNSALLAHLSSLALRQPPAELRLCATLA